MIQGNWRVGVVFGDAVGCREGERLVESGSLVWCGMTFVKKRGSSHPPCVCNLLRSHLTLT